MTQFIRLPAFNGLHGAVERFLETLAIEWFKKVIDRMNFESLQCECVVGRHKNHSGHMAVLEMTQDAEAIELGHLNIQEHQVRLLFSNRFNGSQAIIAFADELDIRLLLKQGTDALASERFIIND